MSYLAMACRGGASTRFKAAIERLAGRRSATGLSMLLILSACASTAPVVDEALTQPPSVDDCAPAYADVFEQGTASMTPIQAEVWLRNIIREPAYSPLGNELISKLSQGRDSDWATLTIGRTLTRTGSSYRFFLHDGMILREELPRQEDGLDEAAAQRVTLDVVRCEPDTDGPTTDSASTS